MGIYDLTLEQLQAALKAEREARTAAEQRVKLLEERVRNAFSFSVWRPSRQKTEPENNR